MPSPNPSLADYVNEVLSQAPPLTAAQRESIITLLRQDGVT